MTQKAKKLIENALRLPPAARAAIAASLIESLDGEVAEAAWAEEIRKRIEVR